MAEIPIQRKESRNWLPLILGLLLLLALLAYCFTRNRGTTAVVADSAAVNTAPGVAAGTTTTDTTAGGAAAGGLATGSVAAGTPGTSNPATGTATTGTATTGGAPGAVSGVTAAGANGLIDQFVQFVRENNTAQETEANHEYTAEGTSRLAAALEGIAGGNPNIGVYADSMRRSIERIRRSSATADTHADDAKAAFSAAVSAMERINRARGRTADLSSLRATYNQLTTNRVLMPQLPTVTRFFREAAEALQTMRS